MAVEEIAVVNEICRLQEWAGRAIAEVLAQNGWEPRGRNRGGSFETAWRRGDVGAWVQEVAGEARVEFYLWEREVDDDVLDEEDGLDRLYEEAENLVPTYSAQLREASNFDMASSDFADDEEEFIAFESWEALSRTVIVGAKQDDTDTPVFVVCSVR